MRVVSTVALLSGETPGRKKRAKKTLASSWFRRERLRVSCTGQRVWGAVTRVCVCPETLLRFGVLNKPTIVVSNFFCFPVLRSCHHVRCPFNERPSPRRTRDIWISNNVMMDLCYTIHNARRRRERLISPTDISRKKCTSRLHNCSSFYSSW